MKPDLITEVAARFENDPYPMLRDAGYEYYRISDEGLQRTDSLEPTIRDNFWFSNYLFSARPFSEIEKLSAALKTKMAKIDLTETSCYSDNAKIGRLTRRVQ